MKLLVVTPGTPNKNGHVYSRECLETALKKCTKPIPLYRTVEDARTINNNE